jgi:Spy/CpxP family protein refolding chaperone
MMNNGKLKVVLYLSAIFLVGGVVGGFVANKFVKQPFQRGPMDIDKLTDRQMRHMARELELTPEQVENIRPIIENISNKVREVRRENFLKLTKLHEERDERMSAELTPEQQIKMKQMEERQRKRVKRYFSGERKRQRPRGDRPPPPEDGPRPEEMPDKLPE